MSAYLARIARVEPVAGDDQVVGAGELVDVGRLGAVVERDAELAAAVLQDLEQPPARHRGEPVATAGDHLALDVDVDVVPDRELPLHPGEHLGVGVLDAAQRLVAEDHAEPERVVGGVALPHGDLVAPAGALRRAVGRGR